MARDGKFLNLGYNGDDDWEQFSYHPHHAWFQASSRRQRHCAVMKGAGSMRQCTRYQLGGSQVLGDFILFKHLSGLRAAIKSSS
jgi:hypothetical protein